MTRRARAARVCWPPEIAVGGRVHSSRAKPEPGERLVDALVERVAAEDVEPVLEVGVVGAAGVAVVLEPPELHGHPLEMRRAVAHGGAEVRARP